MRLKYSGIENPLIIIIGQLCSGKTETLTFLEELNFVGLDMGEFLHNYFQIHFNNRKRDINQIKKLIEKEGRSKIMKEVYNFLISMQKKTKKGYMLCGMRNNMDLKIFTNKFPCHLLLYIYADATTRFYRCKKRKRNGDPINFDNFIRIDMEELFNGLAEILVLNSYKIIINNKSLNDLRKKIKNIVENWIFELKER